MFLFGLAGFTLESLLCAIALGIGALIVLRFIQGFLGGILGPVIGGFIIQTNIADLGWRAVFLVNLPIGVISFILAYIYLPKSAAAKSIKIDLVGALLVVIASGMLVYPLIKGQDAGWPLWT